MNIYYQKTSAPDRIVMIPPSQISANPNQPRKIFSDEAIFKLADSIRQYGIIQPLVVRRVNDSYELVSGERRLRAAKEIGLESVPCVIAQMTEEKSAQIAIIENLLREDLNMFEEALAFESLIDTYGITQEQLAKRLSNSQSYIANKLRLLRLDSETRERILENSLTERHARALLKIHDEEQRARILDKIIDEGLNVTRSEELIERAISKDVSIENQEDEQIVQSAKIMPEKSVRAFYSSIERAINSMKTSGVNVKSRRIENDDFTEITILIPVKQQ
ncbi:MAG: ParB/RepB/Spo0J family partition protein [Clostridia bacterium]|nr:ParB/RepB/Spo0J family partition protein [Clostridia bacterium]